MGNDTPRHDILHPLSNLKPPRRGFEPFHKYFSPESIQYPFKPNMKLLFALMPYLCRTRKSPDIVLCPLAGVGAAPIIVLAYYTHGTTVVAWEDDEKWRKILEENFTRNEFCRGRWIIAPMESLREEVGDSAIFCLEPENDYGEFIKQTANILSLLYEKLKKGSPVVIVSRRLEIDFDETLYTELLLEEAIQWLDLYTIVQVATVAAKPPQRRLYNREAQKDVFAIIKRK